MGAYVAWWILLSAAALAVVWAAHSRPALRELSAGPAKISLSEPSRTYFDDYLDEIVYFFQRSNADIVILEDIDRFGNAEVFDNLRALNTLLNNAKQLRRRPIRFVYAFRDSVFAGPSRARLEPSARTKFFDVIVPVVPFMTHINARDLVSKVMSTDTTTITRELVEVVAPRLTDMRLLKNIRNEFLIYRDQLVDVEASVPGLSDDALFALIVYKNLEISDFEKLQTQGSDLDGLYRAWRSLVDENLARLNAARRSLASQVSGGAGAEARAREAGEKVTGFLQELAAATNRPTNLRIEVGGANVDVARLVELEFWQGVAESQASISVVIGNARFEFETSKLERYAGAQLSPAKWIRTSDEEARKQLHRIDADIYFLQHHDWHQLLSRSDFKAPQLDGPEQSFAQLLGKLVELRVGRDLIRSGHLNRYFAQFVSHFYGEHLRPSANEFLMRHVDPGEPDYRYKLNADDVASLLDERGDSILRDPSAYNVSILDFVLASGDRELVVVAVNQLTGARRPRT